MRIISVRLAESVRFDDRAMPQNQWWNESPEMEREFRDRAARITIEPPFVVLRKGDQEKCIPLAGVKWVDRVPEQVAEGPRPFVASKEPLTEEEEAAGLTAVPSGRRVGWPKGKPRGAKGATGG